MTRQRALILDIMREKSPQHLTADELFNEARLRMPHIARGTVYRNLKMMELDGEIGHLEMARRPRPVRLQPQPPRPPAVRWLRPPADLPVVGLMRRWRRPSVPRCAATH